MIQNFDNTEKWKNKAGNTEKLGNSKLASPPLFYSHAPFPCIHHQHTATFAPLKVSHFTPLIKFLAFGILNLFTFMSLWE